MGNRQFQGFIDATLKNDRHANDYKLSYITGRDRITVSNSPSFLTILVRDLVRQHFKGFRTDPYSDLAMFFLSPDVTRIHGHGILV